MYFYGKTINLNNIREKQKKQKEKKNNFITIVSNQATVQFE